MEGGRGTERQHNYQQLPQEGGRVRDGLDDYGHQRLLPGFPRKSFLLSTKSKFRRNFTLFSSKFLFVDFGVDSDCLLSTKSKFSRVENLVTLSL
jgi:hypothetical protein